MSGCPLGCFFGSQAGIQSASIKLVEGVLGVTECSPSLASHFVVQTSGGMTRTTPLSTLALIGGHTRPSTVACTV